MRPSTCAGTPESICVGAGAEALGPAARTSSWLPPIPPELTITAPAASSNSPTTSRELDRPRAQSSGARIAPVTPSTAPSVTVEPVDAVAEAQLDEPVALRLADAATNGSIRPGPVPQVTWKRGTELPGPFASCAAALGPADVREEADALLVQPRALLAGGPVDVRLGPAARPLVLGPVEAGRAEPVLPRELARVPDPQPPLLGAVDEEEAAERPERLAAERLLRLLVDEDHALPGGGELGGRDEAGEARADDDGVGGAALASGACLGKPARASSHVGDARGMQLPPGLTTAPARTSRSPELTSLSSDERPPAPKRNRAGCRNRRAGVHDKQRFVSLTRRKHLGLPRKEDNHEQ